MSIAEKPGHSAKVDLQLHVDGLVLSLAQVGPELCVLTNPAALPTGIAEIVVTIDGQVQRRTVELLPHTMSKNCRIPIRSAEG